MPVSALVLSRSIRTQQKAALRVARSCLLPSAYQVHYRRAGEPSWKFAGTVEAGAFLAPLILPELAPGEYEVEISTQGFAWKPHLSRTRTRFRVSASGAEPTLPVVSDLQAVIEGDLVVLTWLWKPELGVQSPSDFAVWVSQAAAIDTQVAPTVLVPADGNRRHYARIPTGAGHFVGVATRNNGQVGPLTVVELPQSPGVLPSPEGQFAKPFVTIFPQ